MVMDVIDLSQAEHTLTSDEKLKSWGNGEWVEEPDVLHFHYKGYKCLVQRVYSHHDGIIELGHLCGYMIVPRQHPWHDKACEDIGCDVHGDLTFGERDAHGNYLIGFDCCHPWDYNPGLEACKRAHPEIMKAVAGYENPFKTLFESTYKNFNFVICELKSLVDQAIEAQSKVQP